MQFHSFVVGFSCLHLCFSSSTFFYRRYYFSLLVSHGTLSTNTIVKKNFLKLNFIVWQVASGLYIHTNIIDWFFAIFTYLYTGYAVEQDIGTVRMTQRFFIFGILILTIFSVICGLSGIIQISTGLWPIVFVDLVFICMKNPE